MASRYPSDYDGRGRVEPGISRSGRGNASSRGNVPPRGNVPSRGTRSSASSRSGAPRGASARPGYSGSRTSSQRYAQRPPQRSGAQPRRTGGGSRRGQPNRGPAAIAALAVVLLVALVLIIAKPFGRRANDPVTDGPAVPAVNPVVEATLDPLVNAPVDAVEQVPQYDNLQDKLADSEYDVGSLSAEQMAQVSDLRMNTGLPEEWMNILLLGTDERTLSESARTDSMIICSINRNTGEVKLASIMRDLAIEFTDIGEWNGTYRINAANYFGGPKLAMRTINEKFGMNIQYYVMVNFFGFQKIAQRLGGVEMDITKEEMDKINIMIVQQAKAAYNEGIDESDQENVYLETYGENTHLNGRQTLAYARIRKLTGGDAMRTERQRKVLQKLMEKLKGLDAIQLATLATEMFGQVKTNLPLDDIVKIALQVTGSGLGDIKSIHLPMNGTYKEETRKEQSMLYDCDFNANAIQLYNFIYE